MKKTHSRKHRINSTREWVKSYSGNHIVKSYSKKYAVNKLCAIKELRLIGVEITQEYEIEIKRSVEDLKKQRQLNKEKRDQEYRITRSINSINCSLEIGDHNPPPKIANNQASARTWFTRRLRIKHLNDGHKLTTSSLQA